MCEKLVIPENGSVNYSTTAVNNTGVLQYNLQTNAFIFCAEGFFLNGTQERECIVNLGSGIWTGIEAACEGIDFPFTP